MRDRLGSKESSYKRKRSSYQRKQFRRKESVGIGLKWSQSGSKTQADSSHQRREMD
jgi:hypothetical protein